VRSILAFAMLAASPAILGLVGGCASPNLEVGVTTRAQTYRDFGPPHDLMTAQPPRVAVLPSIATGAHAGQSAAMDMALDKAITEDRTPLLRLAGSRPSDPLVVVPHEVVLNTCITFDLLDELRTVSARIDPGNVLDPDAASRLGRLLDVEYLLLPRLVGIDTDNSNRFSLAGLTFLRTGWTSVDACMQLWHAPSGRLVWQCTGEGTLTAENVVGISPSTQATLDALLDTMLGDLMAGRSQSLIRGRIEEPQPETSASTPDAGSEPDAPSSPPATTDPLETPGS